VTQASKMGLFAEMPGADMPAGLAGMKTGILPLQAIRTLLREKDIQALPDILPDQLQPASLDLRLGKTAYRVRASFLPGPDATVADKIKQLDGYEIDLSQGAVLEKGCVYVVPLMESLDLRSELSGFANPKSSTGRLDILTRLITDRASSFDSVAPNYKGPLFAEIAPRTFSFVARAGTRLNQIRFRRGSPNLAAYKLQDMHDQGKLVSSTGAEDRSIIKQNMLGVTIDLEGGGPGALVGYRAKKHTDRIDIDRIGFYDPLDFWEPIHFHRDSALVLDPDDFYILATREAVRIPPDYAAEMIAYDTSVGEFRVHYAGFFDPGFGWSADSRSGARAVLEVRSHEVPFMLEHGQTVGWLRYERMAEQPDRLYGEKIGSNYQNQGLALAKQFRR
jgi:dCTP deaminase